MLDNIYDDEKGKLILRLMVGVLMLFHGVAKILHPGSIGFIGNIFSGMGLPSFFAYAVYIGEVIAPLMIIVGFRARIGGIILVLNMVVAIVLVHLGDIFSLTQHGGLKLELQLFYLLSGLLVVMFGSGKYAVKPD